MNNIEFTTTQKPKLAVVQMLDRYLANGWEVATQNPLALQRKGCPRKYELRANGALVMV